MEEWFLEEMENGYGISECRIGQAGVHIILFMSEHCGTDGDTGILLGFLQDTVGLHAAFAATRRPHTGGQVFGRRTPVQCTRRPGPQGGGHTPYAGMEGLQEE